MIYSLTVEQNKANSVMVTYLGVAFIRLASLSETIYGLFGPFYRAGTSSTFRLDFSKSAADAHWWVTHGVTFHQSGAITFQLINIQATVVSVVDVHDLQR